jgi:hypothetical protein
MKKTLFSLLGGLAAVIGVVSCNNKNDNTSVPVSYFGVVNASPDSGNLDIYVGGNIAAQNFAYGADSGYFAINPGTYSLQAAPTGTSNFVINSNATFEPAKGYSVFTIDSTSAVITDSFTAPSTDSVRVRFFNFSPNLPAVDLAVSGGSTWFTNRTFNDQASNGGYQSFVTIPAGTYNLELRTAGTSTVLLPLPSEGLEGGKVYTLYARGILGATGTTKPLSVGSVIHNQSIQ